MAFYCKHCDAPVRHISDRTGVVRTCDDRKITIFTDRGGRAEGYKLHECEGTYDDSGKGGRDKSAS